MKLSLSKKLKAWVISSLLLLTQPLLAETPTYNVGVGNGGVLTSTPAGEEVIIDLEEVSGDWLSEALTVNADVLVKSWVITNGHSIDDNETTVTFNGKISDYYPTAEGEGTSTEPADIIYKAWGNGDVNNKYVFKGDMSGFSGDILNQSSNDSLRLFFEGTQRLALAGTGAIDNWKTAKSSVVFNVVDNDGEVQASTVTNTSISATSVSFNGGSTARYEVSSTINTNNLTIADATTVDFTGALTVNTVFNGAAAAIDIGSNATVGFGATATATQLNINSGATVNVNAALTADVVVAAAGSVINLSSGNTLTVNDSIEGSINLEGEGTLTLNGTWAFSEAMTNNANVTFGDGFVLDLTGKTFTESGGTYSFTLGLGSGVYNYAAWLTDGAIDSSRLLGVTTAGREFSFTNGVLSYTVTATTYKHSGGLTWIVGGSGFTEGGDYVDESIVVFTGSSDVTLGSDISASDLTVETGTVTIAGSYSLTVGALLVQSGATMTVSTNAFAFTQMQLEENASLTISSEQAAGDFSMATVTGTATSTLNLAFSDAGSTLTDTGSFAGTLGISSGLLNVSSAQLDIDSGIGVALGESSSLKISDNLAASKDLGKITGSGQIIVDLAAISNVNGTDLTMSDAFTGTLVVNSGWFSALDSTNGGATSMGGTSQVVLKNGSGIVFDASSSGSTIEFAQDIQIADGATATFRVWGGSSVRVLTGALTGSSSSVFKYTDQGALRLDNLGGFSGTLNLEGSTIADGRLIVNDDATLNRITFAAGEILQIAAGKTVTTNGGGAIYTRYYNYGYNIVFEDGASLVDNVSFGIGGGTPESRTTVSLTTTSGTAYYQIQGFFGANTSGADTLLTIGAGVTLESMATRTSNNSSTAAGPLFMLGHYSGSATSIVDVAGTLILNSGISNRDAAGTINVKSGGTLELRQGLYANSNGGTITINAESGSTLKLSTQTTSSNIIAAKLAGGSQLIAQGAAVNVYNNLRLTGTGYVDFSLTDVNASATISSVISNADSGTSGLAVTASAGQTVTLSGDNTHTGGTSIAGGGTLKLQHVGAAGSGTIKIADNSIVEFGGSRSVTNDIEIVGAAQLKGTSSDNEIVLTGDMSSVAAESASFALTRNGGTSADLSFALGHYTVQGSQMTGLNVSVADNATLRLENVTLDAVVMDADAEMANSKVIVRTATKSAQTTLTTHKVGTDETIDNTGVAIYTLEGVSLGILEGTLTLDLSNLALKDEILTAYENGLVGLELKDVTKLGIWYNDVTLDFGGDHTPIKALGVTTIDGAVGSNLVLVIPEPSAVSLSLLAMIGLLARRRRTPAVA